MDDGYSSTNATDYDFAAFYFPEWRWNVVMSLCMAAVGFPANLALFLVILLNSNLRTTSNLLVGNLALADMMMFAFSVPMSTTAWMLISWPGGALGSLLCKLGGAGWALSQVLCATSLTAVSIERFLSLRRRVQAQRTVAILAAVWLLGACFALPLLLLGHTVSLPGLTLCLLLPTTLTGIRAYTTCYAVLTYFLPVLIIVACYAGMARDLIGRGGGAGETADSVRSRRRLAVVVLLLAVAFAVFWFPYHFINMFFAHADFETQADQLIALDYERLIEIASTLIYVNSCLNPFVVFLISRVHRRPLVHSLLCGSRCCCCCGGRPARPPAAVSAPMDGRYAPVPDGVYAETTMSLTECPR